MIEVKIFDKIVKVSDKESGIFIIFRDLEVLSLLIWIFMVLRCLVENY